MPLNVPAGTGIAAFRMTYGTDPEEMICTLGVQAATPPLALAHANRLRDCWRVDIMPLTVATMRFLGVVLRVRQDGGGDLVYESVPASTAGGGNTSAGQPPNVSYLLEKHSGLGGRRGVGRMFLPGVAETNVDEAGFMPGSSVSAFNTALAAFLTHLGQAADATYTGNPVVPVILHSSSTHKTVSSSGSSRTVTVTRGAAGPAPTAISSMLCDPKVSTQRRRLR